jgi:hypothetical protein
MTDQPKDGGPAFPFNEPMGSYAVPDRFGGATTQTFYQRHIGMSLRDWFAGQVLASASALPFGRDDYLHRARVAYEQADAMLAERVKNADATP